MALPFLKRNLKKTRGRKPLVNYFAKARYPTETSTARAQSRMSAASMRAAHYAIQMMKSRPKKSRSRSIYRTFAVNAAFPNKFARRMYGLR